MFYSSLLVCINLTKSDYHNQPSLNTGCGERRKIHSMLKLMHLGTQQMLLLLQTYILFTLHSMADNNVIKVADGLTVTRGCITEVCFFTLNQAARSITNIQGYKRQNVKWCTTSICLNFILFAILPITLWWSRQYEHWSHKILDNTHRFSFSKVDVWLSCSVNTESHKILADTFSGFFKF